MKERMQLKKISLSVLIFCVMITIIWIPLRAQEKVISSKSMIYISGSSSKVVLYKAEESGYHTIRFSWDYKKDLCLDDDKYTIKEEGKKNISTIYMSQKKDNLSEAFYCEAGKIYYIEVEYMNFSLEDEEISGIEVEIDISNIDMEELSDLKAGEYNSELDGRLFQYTAKNKGYKMLKFDWKDKNIYLDSLECGVIDSLGKEIELNDIETEDGSKLYYFYCEAKQTYYINVGDMDFYDTETDKSVDNIDIIVNIVDRKVEDITVENAQNYISGKAGKIFKYIAPSNGYYTLEFSWKNTQEIFLDDYSYGVKNEKQENVYLYTLEENQYKRKEYFYCQEGETYYINMDYFDFYNAEQEKKSNMEVVIKLFKTEPVNTITYSKSAKYTTDYLAKIYRFTAKYNGNHILKSSWDNKNAYLYDWDYVIKDESGRTVKITYIGEENRASYNSFKCEKGKTYYINIDLIDMYLDNEDGDVANNVDVELSVAYYNGKVDLDIIKNEAPLVPEDESGDIDDLNNGISVKSEKIKVSTIKISAISHKIAAGKKVKLAATIAPANASNKAVKWTTSNKKVAKVSQSGVVTVNKKTAGKSVVITAIATDGSGARATYKIKVMKDAVKNLTVTGKKVVKAGKKIKLKAKVAAGKKANKKLVWTSSNTKFATVNQKGVVKTTKAGKGKKVKITARTTDGSNKKKVFTIKIK